jgi:hypothetical protein
MVCVAPKVFLNTPQLVEDCAAYVFLQVYYFKGDGISAPVMTNVDDSIRKDGLRITSEAQDSSKRWTQFTIGHNYTFPMQQVLS